MDSGTHTAAKLFEVLWTELVNVLGTAAAATLVRRAVKRGCAQSPGLCEMRVVRERFAYVYTLPPDWQSGGPAQVPGFGVFMHELVPLLREFTGQIVLRRLAQLPALSGLALPLQEEQ